jgi:hypothetical protein
LAAKDRMQLLPCKLTMMLILILDVVVEQC